MRSLLLPSLLLAGLWLAACATETGAPTSETAERSRTPGEPPTVANTPAPVIAASLEGYNKRLPKRGDLLPALVGTALDGTPISNASLTGKTTLINLWFYH